MLALTGRGPLDQAAVAGKPNGFYNAKTLMGGVDGKQVQNKLWPAGNFNNKEGGPLSAIQHADAKMKGMSQNLSTNQAVMTSYINIPRLVVPVILPGLASDHDIQRRPRHLHARPGVLYQSSVVQLHPHWHTARAVKDPLWQSEPASHPRRT